MRDWDKGLGLGIRIGIRDWDEGLELGLEIWFGIRNWS